MFFCAVTGDAHLTGDILFLQPIRGELQRLPLPRCHASEKRKTVQFPQSQRATNGKGTSFYSTA